MNRTWLILDVSNLAWRNFHATGQLSHGGAATGVLFGIFRDIKTLQDRFSTHRLAWCFDKGAPKRLAIYPEYKERRHKAQDEDPEKKAARDSVRRQVAKLRDEYLTRLGYRNVFHAEGYEADDIMASVAFDLPESDSAVIVSSDKDLFQCCSPQVAVYNMTHKSLTTPDSLMGQYGVTPGQWKKVKALCGCGTDEVGGIEGVGEKTAIKFITGDLTKGKVFDRIQASQDIIARNRKLVRLPYEGCPSFELQEDSLVPGEWDRLMAELGIKTLAAPDDGNKWRREGLLALSRKGT